MARANVKSTIVDESAVIPLEGGDSDFIAGIIDPDGFPENLLGSLGNTHEREDGVMTINSVGEWHERLSSNEATAFPDQLDAAKSSPFYHIDNNGTAVGGDEYAGGTFARWPEGSEPTRWNYLWTIIENYLKYGGRISIYGQKSQTELASEVVDRAKDKKRPIDAFISPFFSENDNVRSVVNSRKDCIAITSVPSEHLAGKIQIDPDGDGVFSGSYAAVAEGNDDFDVYDSNGFYNGTTWQPGTAYSAVPASPAGTDLNVARQWFDRVFVANTGDTYSYEPGRNVFSVGYFDKRPHKFNLGTTTDVLNYSRYLSQDIPNTMSGIAGFTFNIESTASVGVGVTAGLTMNSITANQSGRGWMMYPQDTGLFNGEEATRTVNRDGSTSVFKTLPSLSGRTYDAFVDELHYTDGGITYLENHKNLGRPGSIRIIQSLANFNDYNNFELLATTPTIVNTGASYGDGVLGALSVCQTIRSAFVPSNHHDKYAIGFDLDLNYDGSSSSAALNAGPPQYEPLPCDSSIQRTRVAMEHLPGDVLSAFADLGCDDETTGEQIQVNLLSNFYGRVELMDMRQTLNPEITLLDLVFGATGSNPNSHIYNSLREKTVSYNDIDMGQFGRRPNADLAVSQFKRIYNVFGSSGASLDVADANGNKPKDFWGCTCSQIPEFLRTFNLVGITPDICIEVGPNSRTQDVTAEGSTYHAFIGYSDPFPQIYVNPIVNIFGEEIGTSNINSIECTFTALRAKLDANPFINGNMVSPKGNVSVPVKTFAFYPLIENDDLESSYGLKKDTSNYFYASFFDGAVASPIKDILNPAQAIARTDQNLKLFSHYSYPGEIEARPSDSESKFGPAFDGQEYTTSVGFNITDTGNQASVHPATRATFPEDFTWLATARSHPLGFTFSNAVGVQGSQGVGGLGQTYQAQFFGTGGISLDGHYNDGIYLIAEVDMIDGLPGFAPTDFPFDPENYTLSNIFDTNSDLYEFPVFGEKYVRDSYADVIENGTVNSEDIQFSKEIPFTSDVAGMFARQFRDLEPWFSPANNRVSSVQDIIAERYHLSNAQQDDLYEKKINFIRNIDGGPRLFGDKTYGDPTSSFSRINVTNLFLYLKKNLEALGRRFLFEQNDAESRGSFVNAASQFLEEVQGTRGVSEFRVVCDETNNTPDIVDSNQFVVDIFVKPVKSINFIRLNLTNSGTTFELE